MALITCTECGNSVSDKANFCPHCGAPVEAMRPPVPELTVTCQTASVFVVLRVIVIAIIAIFGLVAIAASPVLGLFILICDAVWGIYEILVMRSCTVTISGGVVTGKTGILHTKKLTSPVSKVQDVGISNGILGKLFGYHTIIISTAGSDHAEYTYRHMGNAEAFQRAFVAMSK